MSGVVDIVDTSVANIASLKAAFKRLGYAPQLTRSPERVASAEWLVLPGVGSFGYAADILKQHELVEPLRHRVQTDQPTLAVCLGMQLLGESSEESSGAIGLGCLPVRATRFSDQVQRPQLGWNEVVFAENRFPSGYAYFANSFRICDYPPGWTAATTEYDGPFASALARGRVLACQFHPELSGRWGQSILSWWLEGLPPTRVDSPSLAGEDSPC